MKSHVAINYLASHILIIALQDRCDRYVYYVYLYTYICHVFVHFYYSAGSIKITFFMYF